MRRVVVLGTGTEIGKTYVTCKIAEALAGSSADTRVLALKPIETGVQKLGETDAARLALASVPVVAPVHGYAFEPAISPHLASRLRGIEIDTAQVVRWVAERCWRSVDQAAASKQPYSDQNWVLIETAGGVFSPISDTKTNLDLAIALEPSCWVLVAGDRLGVLHDVRATLVAMANLARAPDIILLNAAPTRDASAGTNRQELEALGWAKVTGQIAWDGGFDMHDREAILSKLRGKYADG